MSSLKSPKIIMSYQFLKNYHLLHYSLSVCNIADLTGKKPRQNALSCVYNIQFHILYTNGLLIQEFFCAKNDIERNCDTIKKNQTFLYWHILALPERFLNGVNELLKSF